MKKLVFTKAEAVCKALEDEIIKGKLAQGIPLEELVIAERFKCSRTPVREALHQLVTMELAERRPHHGVVVSLMSTERIILFFEAIAEVEALCPRLCIERSSAVEILQISQFYDEMSECVQREDPEEYGDYNRSFHQMILKAAKNEVLAEMSMQAQRRISPYRQVQFEDIQRVKQSHLEHGRIVEAIETRDPELGYKRMYDHIIAAQNMTLKRLKYLLPQG